MDYEQIKKHANNILKKAHLVFCWLIHWREIIEESKE